MMVLETWKPQDFTFSCNSPTVVFGDVFCLSYHPTRCTWSKINLDPLPGKFLIVLVDDHFFFLP